MANTLQLKNDIKKIKSALASKGLSATFKNKLKVKLEKAEIDLKNSTPKGAKATLTSLKEQVKKRGYGVYKGAGVDLQKDAKEPALAIGRRVSKGIKGNQYGNKKSSKGNVYYEYRANRLDVKQPSKTAKYPKLAEGGEVDKYTEVNGTFYQNGTPKGVIDALESARNNKTRVKLFYGDPVTGRDYHEEHDTMGTIGRSTGSIKIPLLISNSRSSGGGAIMTKSILKIRDTKTGRVLYQASNYKQPNIEIVDSNMEGYSNELIIDGDLYSRHKTKRAAELLKSKLMADGGEVFDADYWEIYNEDGVGTTAMNSTEKLYVVDIKGLVQDVIDDFNDDNEMGDVVTPKDFQHIYNLANKFYSKKGWISASIVYTMLIQESRGEYKKGGMMAHGGKLSKKDFFKKYEENEDENMHSENVVLLAENYGTESDIRDAKTILAKHESIGHLPTSLRQERDALHDKLYAKYVQSREDGGMMADGGMVFKKGDVVMLKDGGGRRLATIVEDGFDKENRVRIRPEGFPMDISVPMGEEYSDDKRVYVLHKMEKGGMMADGGVTEKEVVDSNAQMVLSNVKEVKHHADELSKVVTKKSNIEAWVVAKIERASTDLSDVTHYLEGQHDKMSMGGSVYNHLHKMDKK